MNNYKHRKDLVMSTVKDNHVPTCIVTYRECGRLHRSQGRCRVHWADRNSTPDRIEVAIAARYIGCAGFDLEATLYHEIAHAIQAWHVGAQSFARNGHGRVWRGLMHKFGYRPDVTAPVSVAMACKLPKSKQWAWLMHAPDLDRERVSRAIVDERMTRAEFFQAAIEGRFTLPGGLVND